MGLVAKDENGHVIEARVYKIGTLDPEFMAVQKAIMVSLQNEWKNIICEIDSKFVMQCLKEGNCEKLHWSLKPVLKDISSICNSFETVCFYCCRKNFNQLAMSLRNG